MTPMQQAREAWREKRRAKLLNDRTGYITLDDICAHMWNAAIGAASLYLKERAGRQREAGRQLGDTKVSEALRLAYEARALEREAKAVTVLKAQP